MRDYFAPFAKFNSFKINPYHTNELMTHYRPIHSNRDDTVIIIECNDDHYFVITAIDWITLTLRAWRDCQFKLQ